ncbi:MAG: pectate lyase, partial [Prevotella sp.]|nr:pectate lyase [Prevotella sp.]
GGGDNPGGGDDPSGQTITADVECNFQNSAPSNSAFTITNGNYTSNGNATVNGTTYTVGLKIESKTIIEFTTDKEMTLTLVFGSKDTRFNIYVDETKLTGSNYMLTTTLGAGTHKLTKADTGTLFYIGLKAN